MWTFFIQFGAFLFIRSLTRSPARCAVHNVICVNELISTLKIFMFAQQQGILFGLGRQPDDQFLIRIYVFSCDNSLACFSLRFHVVLFLFRSKMWIINKRRRKNNTVMISAHSYVFSSLTSISLFIFLVLCILNCLLVWFLFRLTTFFGLQNYNTSVATFQCRHSVERREEKTVLIALIFFRFFLSIFTIMFWYYLLCFVIYAN